MPEETLDPFQDIDTDLNTQSVRDLVDWQRFGTLELRPRFQRDSVWKNQQKSFLIDSIVKGFPVPLIVVQNEPGARPTDVTRRVVDGQQRLRTIIAFVEPDLLTDRNESDDWLYYPTTQDGPSRKGYRFDALPTNVQDRILATKFAVSTVERGTTVGQVLEIYDRLNSTGSRLTQQELRWARREGRFSDLCYRLARRHQSRWVDWRIFTEVDIKRMKDVEFASELVLMLMNGIDKTGKKEIDDAYTAFKDQVPSETELEERFDRVMEELDDAFSYPSKPDPIRVFRSRGWFYALFAWQDANETLARGALPQALGAVAERVADDRNTNAQLVRAISGSASDKRSRDSRFTYLAQALKDVLG